jgi:D-alanyl-D-alanine carboxypeptidase (penicillin-binding protein 5/6)
LTTREPLPIMVAPFRLDDALDPAAPVPPVLPVAPALLGPPGHTRRRPHASHRHRARRWRVLAALGLVVVLALAGWAAVRLHAPQPVAAMHVAMEKHVAVRPAAVTLPWPATGQSAVAVPAVGVDVTSGLEQPVPIASLTKMMTAFVVLRDHPLTPDQDGPSITMTQADVDDFDADTVEDQANAEVALGEVLTERQLLEGLLVHSANNFADTLARWDAGDIPTFVAKMNSTAQELDMHQTHYADPSGFDQGSQSTAGDLLKVAGLDMDDPTFAAIVRMSSVTLPEAGTISTYTPWLGFQGVIGVKSGFTNAAGGCDVVAVVRHLHGKDVMILAAVTGQTGPEVLEVAGYLALNLADHAAGSIGVTPVVQSGQVVGHVSVEGHRAAAASSTTVTMLSWPGVTAQRALVDGRRLRAGAERGTQVASMAVALGTQRAVVPVRLQQSLPKATMLQRLF